jgi:hypothetical protein
MNMDLLSENNVFPEITPFNFVMGHPTGFNAIKRGSTMECLADLKRGSLEVGTYRYIVSDMMGATDSPRRTVYHWFSGDHRPTGMSLLKVWYFLSCRTYQIDGLERLPKNFRLLMEYLVLKKVTLDKVTDFLILPNQKALLDIFDGRVEATNLMRSRASILCHTLWAEENEFIEDDSSDNLPDSEEEK